MNKFTFELELVQLEEFFSKSRSNQFSDSKRKAFFLEIKDLFDSVSSSDYNSFDDFARKEHKSIFTYLFNGLEFLDTSTLNEIPYELVLCLEKALEDWVNHDNLIIVTSISNRNNDIWFEGFNKEYIKQLKSLIYSKYSKDISYRLIRITLPKSMSRDYLSSVVLYHELGHFIDDELNISNKIFYSKYKKLPSSISTRDEQRYYSHYKEFFADLFAAQYVNDSSASYLNHLAHKQLDSDTHPATFKRNQVVNNFLSNIFCQEIEEIQNALKKSGNPPFSIKHNIIEPSRTEFNNLVPEDIDNNETLHGIFKLGWDLWLASDKNFLNQFSRRQKYHVINNLIEKSISNYNVTQNWEANKTLI